MRKKKITIEYGAMSSKYSLVCYNKFDGYAAILSHYANHPGLVVIYSPEELKVDSWMNFSGDTHKRVDRLFQDFGGFEPYLKSNISEIRKAYKTIKKIV